MALHAGYVHIGTDEASIYCIHRKDLRGKIWGKNDCSLHMHDHRSHHKVASGQYTAYAHLPSAQVVLLKVRQNSFSCGHTHSGLPTDQVHVHMFRIRLDGTDFHKNGVRNQVLVHKYCHRKNIRNHKSARFQLFHSNISAATYSYMVDMEQDGISSGNNAVCKRVPCHKAYHMTRSLVPHIWWQQHSPSHNGIALGDLVLGMEGKVPHDIIPCTCAHSLEDAHKPLRNYAQGNAG